MPRTVSTASATSASGKFDLETPTEIIRDMKTIPVYLSLLWFLLNNPQTGNAAENEKERLVALDAYWAEVSRTVREGAFEGYKATCHEQGVLVSGSKRTSYPLSKALARWKKDFTATKAGKIKAKIKMG